MITFLMFLFALEYSMLPSGFPCSRRQSQISISEAIFSLYVQLERFDFSFKISRTDIFYKYKKLHKNIPSLKTPNLQ